MNVTEETKEHAQHILNYINAFPNKHDQDSWFHSPSFDNKVTEENFCGTTMCVAGTSVFLKDGIEGLAHGIDFEVKGRNNLGLDRDEGNFLFYTMNENKAKAMLEAVANGDKAEFERIYQDDDEEYEDE